MSEFRREDRYLVFKRKDLAILPKQMQDQLSELTAMVGQWVPSRQYVVVESDWPEYERVFAMIEARVTGQQLNPTIRQVQPLVCPKCNALWLFWPKEQSGFDADTLSVKSAKHCEFCEGASADQLSTLGIAATPAQACLEKLRGGVEVPEPFGLFCGVRHDPPKTKEFWGMLNENARQETKCDLFTHDQLLAYGAAQRLAGQQRETCTWTEQDDKDMPGTYESSCGEMWSFIEGGVKENRVTYCHRCGGKVAIAAGQQYLKENGK